MSKSLVKPGQESFAIEAQPQSLEPFSPVSYLNVTEGLIRLEDLPDFDFDPERQLTYLEFLGEIGIALAEELPQRDDWDRALEVHGDDFNKASTSNLNKGLYFSPGLSRRRPDVITVSEGELTLSKPPGVRAQSEGVAVSSDEFRVIARSPEDFAKHIYSKTETANEKRDPKNRLDEETLMNTAGRSIVHGIRQKKEALLELDEVTRMFRQAAWMVNGLVSARSDERRPMADLDLYRLGLATATHGTIKVACRQLRLNAMRRGAPDYGTTTRRAIDRVVESLTLRGEPDSIAAANRDYTKWVGYYMDAKRGKIYQSLSWCKSVFDENKHFLKTKQPDDSTDRAA